MSFIVQYLRQMLRRPPVVIFLVMVLASCLAGYGIVYFALTTHQSAHREGYLRLETGYLVIEFPKEWMAAEVSYENESGSIHGVQVVSSFASVYLGMHDEKYTQFLMGEFDLTDAFSTMIYMVNDTYGSILERNENATLHFVENKTVRVLDLQADYTRVLIRDVPDDDGVLQNVTLILMAAFEQRKLTYIGFYALEENWEEAYGNFQIILDSIEIRR